MFPKELQPLGVTDVVYRTEEYLMYARSLDNDTAVEFFNSLEEYVVLYFRDQHIDKAKLKRDVVEMANALYLLIMNFETRDSFTDAYFDIILGSLFDQITKQDVSVFFILIDELYDDRFILVKELFELMLFTIVTPYEYDTLESDGGSTRIPSRHYGLVEDALVDAFGNSKNIVYIEKDKTVSYVHRLTDLVENLNSSYQCIYRNQPITIKKALWLRGKTKTEIGL